MTFDTWFESIHPEVPLRGAAAVIALVAEGATLPFIARYRKEQTGNLDEVAIQKVIDSKERFEEIVKRQEYVIGEIEKHGKLAPEAFAELKSRILATFKASELEDLYLPYKVKRKSKAQLAREAGLEPLADWIWNTGHGTEAPMPGQTLELWAFTFRNDDKGFPDAEKAIGGAQDILIERLSEKQELRALVRKQTFEEGAAITKKGAKSKKNSKFENYFDHHELISTLLKSENSHRYLAMRRGWMEEELMLSIGGTPSAAEAEAEGAKEGGKEGGRAKKPSRAEETEYDRKMLSAFEAEACTVPDSPGAEVLKKAARLALKAHVLPSIEAEAHKALKEVADGIAIDVFAENVRKLMLASPFGAKAVLGVDPGLRTGCKLAVVDDSGKYLASTVMHIQSEDGKTKAKAMLQTVVKEANIRAVAVGNGTAGRETEIFVRQALKEGEIAVPVVMVSEAGASVYSASEAAREEFPELDVTIRGAISIARRLQDPLAELVKIDPKSIGVGQYQHDVSPNALKRSLEFVVDSCVNSVGVNLNTASYHLLSHVAGIGESLGRAIMEHRSAKGLFKSRQELLEVPRFSQKVFEQAAGFLRISDADNPLDNTGVHPERYAALQDYATKIGKELKDLLGEGVVELKKARELKDVLGEFTFNDVIAELGKPGRDPRDEFVPFQYRDDVHELKDLTPGMRLPGIVTNVTNFGAFVDVGVHQDGLVHISQLSDKYVKDPREVVSPGDRVEVRVLEVLLEKNQIAFSMKGLRAGAVAGAGAEAGESKSARAPREKKARGGRGRRGERKEKPTLTPIDPNRPMPNVVTRAELSERIAASGPPPVSPNRPGGVPHQRRDSPVRPQGPPKPQVAFNNPFAGLAALKSTLKQK